MGKKSLNTMQNNNISTVPTNELVEGIAQSNTKAEPQQPQNKESKNPFLPIILESQKKLREAKAQTVIFSPPIVSHLEKQVIYPNTINVIQGQAGVHKSRVAELICSTLLKRADCPNVLAGFEAFTGKEFTVCIVDTERNLNEQLPYALQSIQTKAGFRIEEHPDGFDYISLMNVPRNERFEALREYLDHVRTKFQNHIFIVLDVLTDCCQDFNRTDSSMALIDHLNMAINQFDVTFLCIIHENPGHAKARGHLGTELTNKASSVMQVGYETDAAGKDTNLIRVKFLKCRNTKRHEPFYLKYCDTFKGLVLADEGEVSRLSEQRKAKAMPTEVADKIEQYLLDEPMQSKELVELLMKDFEASQRTIEERVKEIISADTGFHNSAGKPCRLVKEQDGRKVFYFLKPND
jgi:hypothetical protein